MKSFGWVFEGETEFHDRESGRRPWLFLLFLHQRRKSETSIFGDLLSRGGFSFVGNSERVGGPSNQGQAFVDIAIRIEIYYRTFILWRQQTVSRDQMAHPVEYDYKADHFLFAALRRWSQAAPLRPLFAAIKWTRMRMRRSNINRQTPLCPPTLSLRIQGERVQFALWCYFVS